MMNREHPTFKGRLDLERIGVTGHSFGAHTTLTIAGQNYTPRLGARTSLADPRVKAVLPMSAPVPANKSNLDAVYSAIKIPCLHMTGTKDTSPINDTKAEERRLPFDHSKNSDQFLMTFQDGDHMIFSGRPRMMGGGDKDTRFHELICESSTLFWDAYLREDANAKARLMNEFKNSLGVNGTFEVKLHR
jgi:predicted dienelactone hydrolase